ncbi:MAG: hypothetical protein HFF50_03190 [Lawsonibacter sp.]|nr:hypothetical protein [Lawsonibacter sp.]
MKQIQNFDSPKYKNEIYSKADDGIYQLQEDGEALYVTSLSFVQEPELGEGPHAGEISQYPLEDILDQFLCYISDFYEEQNTASSQTCCLEFAAPNLEDIRKLRSILGKHVYNREEGEYTTLVID